MKTSVDYVGWPSNGQVLLGKGVKVNAKTTNGWTALHQLCRLYTNENLVEIVRLLVENGADVNAKSLKGKTALHRLCENYTNENLVEIVRLLIEKGADVNAVTKSGSPPLLLLRHGENKGKKDVEEFLVAKRALEW